MTNMSTIIKNHIFIVNKIQKCSTFIISVTAEITRYIILGCYRM